MTIVGSGGIIVYGVDAPGEMNTTNTLRIVTGLQDSVPEPLTIRII